MTTFKDTYEAEYSCNQCKEPIIHNGLHITIGLSVYPKNILRFHIGCFEEIAGKKFCISLRQEYNEEQNRLKKLCNRIRDLRDAIL